MNSYIIEDQESLELLISQEKLFPPGYVVIDTETDNKSEKLAKLHGIGLSFEDDEAFYIPIRNNKKELVWSRDQLDVICGWLYDVCSKRGIVGHNIIYDVLVLENNFGWDVTPFITGDSILAKHLCDEERPFGLKEVAVKYLGDWADKAQEVLKANIRANGGSITKENMEMWKADGDILGDYCNWDVVLTRKLYTKFKDQIDKEGLTSLLEEEVMPFYQETTINMKRKGFPIDIKHFEQLKVDIIVDIKDLEESIMGDIKEEVENFEKDLLNKDYPIKVTGTYPKILAECLGQTLPLSKEGKYTLAKKAIENCNSLSVSFKGWLLGDSTKISDTVKYHTQRNWFFKDNPDKRYIFNLKSNAHLSWLLFDKIGEVPKSHTETGKAQCDDTYLESIKKSYIWVEKLTTLKKLQKILSTYIEGILERQIDGIIYSSMLMFGTTSGRYSSTNPNLQNLYRIKDSEAGLSPLVLKYANAIKKGFVAPFGYKILNADYNSLEPVCFAHMSGDERLREVFRMGYDLYSAIAIDVFGLLEYSADKKAPNYLGKHKKEIRQKSKVFCLAVVYGAGAGRISQAMNISYEEAQEIIDKYLNSYPQLKKYMDNCDYMAKKKGYVRSEFGRIRHLPLAKRVYSQYGDKLLSARFANAAGLKELRYAYKNELNLSKNFPIQSLAAHIVNKAMLATTRAFKANNIEGYIVLQVHDEITCIVREDQVELSKEILKECMEKTTQISVPLSADPMIADNWADAK